MGFSNKVIRNFIALGTGEALSRLIAFGATIYLARLLGAENYGVIAFAIAVNLYLIKISEFALEWVGTSEVAAHPEKSKSLVPALLTARLSVTLLMIIVTSIISWLFIPDPERTILLLYLFLLIPTSMNTKWVHIGLEKSNPVGISRVSGEAIALLIIVTLVKDKNDIWVAPIAQTISEIFIAYLLYRYLRKYQYKINLIWNPSVVLPIFRKAMPLVSHMLLGLFIYNSDMIFLRLFHDSKQVGFYSVAYVLISFIANIGIAYGLSITPAFTHLKNNIEQEKTFYQTVLMQIFIVSIPISIGGFILAENTIGFIFGDGYTGSILALQIIIWSVPFNLFRNAPWVALIIRNRQDLLFKAILYAAMVNVILNIALIPGYGILGASIATLLTEIFISILMLVFAAQFGFTFVPVKKFFRPLIASLCMAFFLTIISPDNFLIGFIIGIAVYISALSITGVIQYKKGSIPTLKL